MVALSPRPQKETELIRSLVPRSRAGRSFKSNNTSRKRSSYPIKPIEVLIIEVPIYNVTTLTVISHAPTEAWLVTRIGPHTHDSQSRLTI
jgi:hypothetical protein